MGVGAAAVRIVSVHQVAQFLRVLAADLLVAALPDENGGIIAIIDEDIAEVGDAEGPGPAFGVMLAVATGLKGDDAEPVGRQRFAPGRRGRAPSGRKLPPASRMRLHGIGTAASRAGRPRARATRLVDFLAPAAKLEVRAVDETGRASASHRMCADAERDLGGVERPGRRQATVDGRRGKGAGRPAPRGGGWAMMTFRA